MSDLILAVPSKGRLEENAAAIFANAGVALKRAGARGYRGSVSGIGDIDVQYVSASEIAARLADGSVHMGITGEDLLREEIPDMDSVVQLVLPLGFGRADVVVAIPDGWVDVQNMADLAEIASEFRARNGKRLRVATKYTHLTADFFARHGLVDYRWLKVSVLRKLRPMPVRQKQLSILPRPGPRWGPISCVCRKTGLF